MRRGAVLALAVAVAGLLAATAPSADAPTRTVSMPGKLYEPAKLDVLLGTTVTWKNEDAANHTVTADGDAFSSGYIPPGGSFTFTFAKEGRYTFHCTIHKFMRGEVSVFGLVLSGPDGPVTSGRRIVLAGLAPAGTTDVTVRGTDTSIAVHPKPDGSFALRFPLVAPDVYRATAGPLSSPPVRIAARPVVKATHIGHAIRAVTAPARPGATALLQAYDRERFDWVAVGRTTLDAGSRARFTAAPGLDRVRVLVRGSKGWADAVSTTLLVHSVASRGGRTPEPSSHIEHTSSHSG
jgi:plastocyanin